MEWLPVLVLISSGDPGGKEERRVARMWKVENELRRTGEAAAHAIRFRVILLRSVYVNVGPCAQLSLQGTSVIHCKIWQHVAYIHGTSSLVDTTGVF